jgi:NAD(P)-dependent dehydrogenase (short-subunit alcohol dehydrogenase family)
MLAGRTVLVTGGAGFGIGAGICSAVQAAGGTLVINDVDADAAERAAARHPGSFAVPGDVGDEAGARGIIDRAVALAGDLDGLVNNAGVGLNTPAHRATTEQFDRLYGIDVRGVWLMSRAFAVHRTAGGGAGSIVTISSAHAHATQNGYALYAGAKAAVEGLTRGMAVELGQHGIRVNAVAPGLVHAEQNAHLLASVTDDPEGYVADHAISQQALPTVLSPVDVGWPVAFLLSSLAAGVTGTTLAVDAGATIMLYDRRYSGDLEPSIDPQSAATERTL